MHEDDEECTCDVFDAAEFELAAQRLHWADLATIPVDLVGRTTRAISDTCASLSGLLAMHAQYAREQRAHLNEVAEALEAMDLLPTAKEPNR